MCASTEFLQRFIRQHPRLFVLTGAGCSTASGIPDYRDQNGQWKRTPPMTIQAYMSSVQARRRYWARSLVGWRHFSRAQPNDAHRALALLEELGYVQGLVTQNVDGLHSAAGSRSVIDLHGRIDQVICMQCGHQVSRARVQVLLEEMNPEWRQFDAAQAPDGDADLDGQQFEQFHVPPCPGCSAGILKPDVVFFGENVPRSRVAQAMTLLEAADAVLVVGSSLTVFSGFRFVRAAATLGLPIIAVNLGRTRADALLTYKITEPCDRTLTRLTQRLGCTLQG